MNNRKALEMKKEHYENIIKLKNEALGTCEKHNQKRYINESIKSYQKELNSIEWLLGSCFAND